MQRPSSQRLPHLADSKLRPNSFVLLPQVWPGDDVPRLGPQMGRRSCGKPSEFDGQYEGT